MLSHAMMTAQQQKENDEEDNLHNLADDNLSDDEFDEISSRPSIVRSRSTPPSKVDFCCLPADVIRCVCANIIAHIQSSESSDYIPPPQYDLFSKESGSLVQSPFFLHSILT